MAEIVNTNTKLYTLKDLSQMLGVTERTLHNYIKAGKLHGQKIGGKWCISQVNLENFINGKS